MSLDIERSYAPSRQKENVMYKTEAHIHTKEVSECGQGNAADIVAAYAAAGYDTVFITDHINSNFSLWEGLSWAEKVDKHRQGYEAALEVGERLGIRVLYGAEIAFSAPGGYRNDYLVYGFDRDFLIGFESLYNTSIEEFYPYAREHGVLVIQAHPYREGFCAPKADYVDGVEVCNAHPRHKNNNDRALTLAKERGLLMTVGSDVHMLGDVGGAALLTEKRIETVDDYISVIKSGTGVLMGMDGVIV